MTKKQAIKGLKENLCSLCAYGSQNMDSCDIRECDNRDYIKALEQQSIEECVSRKAVFETIDDCNSDGLKGIFCSYDDGERFKEYIKKLPTVIPTFPEGTTNGDIMTAMFPDIKIREHEKTDICDAYIQIDIWDFSICVSKDWWDEPYKRGSEA